MKTIYLSYERGNTDSLLAMLKGHVFHLTSATAYDEIKRAGKILNNKDGNLSMKNGDICWNTSSEFSYGRMQGRVCLLDLRNPSVENVESICSRYAFLAPDWLETDRGTFKCSELTYLILHARYHKQLIYPSSATPPSTEHNKYLPYGEVWIKDHIPLKWIDTVILATCCPIHKTLLETALENAYKSIFST
jgi:hypothetical protein